MKLFSALFDLATLPIEIVKDVVTLGGTATEREKTYTKERFEKLDNDFTGEPYKKDNRLFD